MTSVGSFIIIFIASNAHAYHSKVKSSKTVKISRTPKPERIEPMTIAAICSREMPALAVGDSVVAVVVGGITRTNESKENPASM